MFNDRLSARHIRFVRLAVHKPLQRAAGRGAVHRKLKPHPGAFADREFYKIIPRLAAPNNFCLGVADMAIVIMITARVQHIYSTEPQTLDRLDIGCDRFSVGLTVKPGKIAPGLGGVRRIDKIIPKREPYILRTRGAGGIRYHIRNRHHRHQSQKHFFKPFLLYQQRCQLRYRPRYRPHCQLRDQLHCQLRCRLQ